MSEVWALDLVPVVRERRPGTPGVASTFSDEQIAAIVEMRDQGIKWEAIGRTINRPWKSCQRRYFIATRDREPSPNQPTPSRKADKLYEELGIGVVHVWQAQIGSFGNVNKVRITLSSGFKDMAWTKGQDDLLRERLADGDTHADVAKRINDAFGTSYTRNATIGRAHRLDVDSKITCSIAAKRPRQARAPKAPHIRPRASACVREMPLLRCVEVEPRHVGLLDLKQGECRYPYGGDVKGDPITFCGCLALEKLPYCESHTVLTRRAAA